MKPLDISVVVDNPESWIIPYAKKLVQHLKSNHKARFCSAHNKIQRGDIAFFLGCIKKTSAKVLERNRHNLVVHESDLPRGKGFSPLAWQIVEDKNVIPIVLFEAAEEIDAGPIYMRDELVFEGHELIDELRQRQGEKTLEMCLDFVKNYHRIKPRPQKGEATYFYKRKPKDNMLDVDRSIREQFNLLRVVDNDRYPAFFKLHGYTYIINIKKDIL